MIFEGVAMFRIPSVASIIIFIFILILFHFISQVSLPFKLMVCGFSSEKLNLYEGVVMLALIYFEGGSCYVSGEGGKNATPFGFF